MMIKMQPIGVSRKHQKYLSDRISDIFYQVYLQPLKEAYDELMQEKIFQNSASDETILTAALKSGVIRITGNQVTGKFNAQISKALENIGGQFDKMAKVFILPAGIPIAVQQASFLFKQRQLLVLKKLTEVFAGIDVDKSVDKADLEVPFFRIMDTRDAEFKRQVEKIAQPELKAEIGVNPSFTAESKKKFVEGFTVNTKKAIKNFSEKQIKTLREKLVPASFTDGGSTADLEKALKESFNLSTKRAKYIAAEESRLFIAHYNYARYKDAGITHYRWLGVGDSRQRPDHKQWNNKILPLDVPVLIDSKNGRTGFPGEDYGCRCTMQPIIDFNPSDLQEVKNSNSNIKNKIINLWNNGKKAFVLPIRHTYNLLNTKSMGKDGCCH